MSPVLRHSLGCLLVVIGTAGTAMAETTAQSPYQLLEKGDQVVRLHTQTGIVDLCTKQGTSLVCRLSADERMSLLEENQRLEARIEELENKIGESSKTEKTPSVIPDKLLTEKDKEKMNEAMDCAERFFRRFIEVVKDLKQDLETSL